MSIGIVKKAVSILTLLALAGCGTTATGTTPRSAGVPILSGADARAMIRVEVQFLESAGHERLVAGSRQGARSR